MRIPRQAARVAVLDPAGAVFMFRYDNVEVGVHWALPGGGMDPGETPLQAAVREVREETGWTDIEPGGTALCFWEHDFTRVGVPVRQYEHIFLAYGPHREPGGELGASQAAEGILGGRWWSPGDLADTAEALWPPRLPELLAAVRRDGPPTTPVDLGFMPNGRPGPL
ncbi:NUDIX domain-containing protein [Streptomyces sp. NPDC026665]|uniref:NUDIX hydrolase n=1 Tax=Streptomyces sp. NPDC026665 TaxID=3154798 RepID=UPI0033EC1515